MYLTAATVIPWLIQKGVLSGEALLRRPWTVIQPDHNRALLRVSSAGSRGWMVKQASPIDANHVAMLDREAAFQQLVRDVSWAYPIAPLLPRFRLYDQGVHALVVEALPYDTGLDALRRRDANANVIGRLLGAALAAVHQRVPRRNTTGAFLPSRLPWILQPEAAGRNDMQQPAVRRMVELVQRESALISTLEALRNDWRDETLIHGDVKLDNVLVRTASRPRVWLIDWGFTGIGDPAWDVGTVMHSCLVLWLHGVRLTHSEHIDAAVAGSALPIQTTRVFAISFLAAYEAARKLRGNAATEFARRTFRYAGAAVVQTAIAAGRGQQEITPRQLGLVQMGINLLGDPDDAMRTFRLARSWERA